MEKCDDLKVSIQNLMKNLLNHFLTIRKKALSILQISEKSMKLQEKYDAIALVHLFHIFFATEIKKTQKIFIY